MKKTNPGFSCLDILKNGPAAKKSGLYFIENPLNIKKPHKVYCDQTTDRGGWTLFTAYNHNVYEKLELNQDTKYPKDTDLGRSHVNLEEVGLKNDQIWEIRFLCTTEHENTYMHFKTSNKGVIEAAVTGLQIDMNVEDLKTALIDLEAP